MSKEVAIGQRKIFVSEQLEGRLREKQVNKLLKALLMYAMERQATALYIYGDLVLVYIDEEEIYGYLRTDKEAKIYSYSLSNIEVSDEELAPYLSKGDKIPILIGLLVLLITVFGFLVYLDTKQETNYAVNETFAYDTNTQPPTLSEADKKRAKKDLTKLGFEYIVNEINALLIRNRNIKVSSIDFTMREDQHNVYADIEIVFLSNYPMVNSVLSSEGYYTFRKTNTLMWDRNELLKYDEMSAVECFKLLKEKQWELKERYENRVVFEYNGEYNGDKISDVLEVIRRCGVIILNFQVKDHIKAVVEYPL